MNIIEKLAELQKQFYKKCGDLYEAIEVLGKPLYDKMLNDYSDTYKKLSEILSLKFDGEYEYDKYFYTLKKSLQTPKQRGFLWLFKNEAKKLANREANAEIRSHFNLRWEAVEALEEANEEAESTTAIEQPKPSAAVEPTPGTAAQVNGSTREPAAVVPPSEPSTAAPGASDAAHQSDEKTKKTAEDVAKPPAAAPTSEEPKPKAKPKKIAQPTTEPPATTAPAPQLAGQINFEDLTSK
ncbi:MAG: hypothetical protein K2O44_01740 [Clostridia bacterium]|nr:hypothetical protein [Clostridia bacterium]